jgi:hypothetical protein
MKAASVLPAIVLLAGCSAGPVAVDPTSAGAPTEQPAPPRAAVQWEDYDAAIKTNIDELQATADCDALQEAFDTADSNNAATRDRTGHSNAMLMTYIDEALRLADCY